MPGERNNPKEKGKPRTRSANTQKRPHPLKENPESVGTGNRKKANAPGASTRKEGV